MNLFRKYIVFLSFIGLAAILIAAAVVNLVSSLRAFESQKHGLERDTLRWQQLHSRDPYPSPENVRRVSNNVRGLQGAYSSLIELLRGSQVNEEEMEAAAFMSILENTIARTRNMLGESRVVIPENFALGFDRYAVGQLPAPDDIPRLVQQLRIVELLCGVLSECGVTELASISREILEDRETAPRAPARPRRRAAPAERTSVPSESEEDRLYSTQSFTIMFRARESAVFAVLNRIAGHPVFSMITSMEIVAREADDRTREIPRPVSRRETDAGADKDVTPRGQRVIIRREELEVSLRLDVYQFMPPATRIE